MTLEELNLELKRLVGATVSFKRNVGNNILIYFFDNVGNGSGVYFLISPAWRYQQNGELILGSDDFPEFEDSLSPVEYRETFERMCALTNELKGARLEDCEVDFETSDLLLKFSGGQVIHKFASSAFDEAAWSYNDDRRDIAINFSPSGIELDSE